MKKENFMQDKLEIQIYAEVLERLILHLRKRTDVQNIDLMNLAGFCRNCLSRWYREESGKLGKELSDQDAREIIYGMPYENWKQKFQTAASKAQMEALKKSHPH